MLGPSVVEDLNPPGDLTTGLIPGGPFPPVIELGIQRRPEKLHHRIIETHASVPDGLVYPEFLTDLVEQVAGEVPATVGMEYNAVGHLSNQRGCHPQSMFYQISGVPGIHRQAQHPAGMPVPDRTQIQPTFTGAEIGGISEIQT